MGFLTLNMLPLKVLSESFYFAVDALKVNKLRTFLSLLGISVGIFSIISVFTLVDSLESNVRNSLASLGDNVIYIQKWSWEGGGPDYPWWKYLNRPVPSYTEMKELQRRNTVFNAVAFMVSTGNKVVKYQSNNVENVDISAVTSDYNRIKTFELKEGRYISENEFQRGKAVAVIGYSIAEGLFNKINALEKEITVMGRKFTVIGIINKEGDSMLGNSSDSQIIIPLNYARKLVDIRSENLQPLIMLKGKEGISNKELKDELRGIMRSIRSLKPKEEDNFSMNEAKMIATAVDSLFSVIGIAGWVIGGFSILVGGFGIANIMFVSVKERTNIIGIQKSLGATNVFILFEFLIEAVILCAVGGSIGLAMVFIGTLITSSFFDLELFLTYNNIILGLLVSVIIGVVSGFWPAYKASRMDPVEAIRVA